MLLIALGIFIFYLLVDFLVVKEANINKFGEKWIKKTLWLWLPIYGAWRLTREVIFKKRI
ncbi:MAG TPA: hypothetical protein DIT25_04135 [Candidatus Moranbacteria bacterium]|nr:hypothetical protein [Candidatus Moranbacteria bacterium]